MKAFTEPLSTLSEYEEIQKLLKQGNSIELDGCVDSQKLHMIYGLGEKFQYRLIVTFNELRAKEIEEDFKFYDPSVKIYPAKDLIFYQADIRGNLLTKE